MIIADAAERAAAHLRGLEQRDVLPTAEAVAALARLRTPLPAGESDPAQVIAELDAIGSPATVATPGRRYFGFVTGGALPVTVAASVLSAAWDQNAAFRVLSPVAATLEDVVLAWMIDLFGLPPASGGALVSGATMANFSALVAARRAIGLRAGVDVDEDGLYGAPPITVVVGDEVHISISKALGMMGLGRRRVVRVPADGQGRMRADGLPKMDPSTIVCLQAGNVNTGAFDPAAEIVRRAHDAGAWVHVDGAFGLWAIAVPSLAAQAHGFANADSWAVDAHKWLNVPYDNAFCFVRDPEALRGAMAMSASYLAVGSEREPCHFTPEISRRARAVEPWAALRQLGRAGIRGLIERCCRFARRMADGLREDGHEILNEVVLNQVLVSFGDRTRRVIEAIQRAGTCWCGGTEWQGRSAMRISFSNWATRDEDVERSLETIRRLAQQA